MKSYFYAKSMYTAVSAFADIFNDMSVRVYNTKGEIIGVKPVPATLTPREKIVSILKAGNVNDVDPQQDNYLPRISINLNGMSWDSERMRGKIEKRLLNIEYAEDGSKRSMQVDMQPIPFNLNFEVVVWSKYMTDGMQIIENIVPWFAPEIHVSYKERNFGIEHKSKVTLDGVSPNFVYEYGEGGDNGRRILQWNLSFTMEAIIWKPMQLNPEILCSIISISNVPCEKLPFPGSKIVSYEPITNQVESLFSKESNLSVFNLDSSESYDLMTNYWKMANRNMEPHQNIKCVDDNCAENPGPRPDWDPALGNTPCNPVLKKPVILIDPLTECIHNFWQEMVTIDSVITIISYKRIYSEQGVALSDATVISNSEYPVDNVTISNIENVDITIPTDIVSDIPVALENCSGAS